MLNVNRQSLQKIYVANGAIYIFNKKNFLQTGKIPYKNLSPLIMDKIESLDINDKFDYTFCKKLQKKIIYKWYLNLKSEN